MQWYLTALKKYADFSGRARRAEFWNFVLFNFIISIVLNILDMVLGTAALTGGIFGILAGLYGLFVLIPSLAVSARRLHDTGRTGWWLLLLLIPLVGPIVLIVFTVQDSQPGANKYGPNPKEGGMGAETPAAGGPAGGPPPQTPPGGTM